MRLWRIARRNHAGLDGEGARLYGARWSSPGTAVVYAASHLSLAALEYLVRVDPDDAPDDLVALRLDVPEEATALTHAPPSLPAGWQRTPAPPECQAIGDRWARNGQHLLLQLPSVLVPEESNLLVNPKHRDAPLVHVSGSRPLSFDPRLLGRLQSQHQP